MEFLTAVKFVTKVNTINNPITNLSIIEAQISTNVLPFFAGLWLNFETLKYLRSFFDFPEIMDVNDIRTSTRISRDYCNEIKYNLAPFVISSYLC